MALAKLLIEILDAEAAQPRGALPPVITAQFNPTEYALTKGAQIAEIGIPGIDSPILQFIRGQNERLALDLLFDTTDVGGFGEGARDVRVATGPVYQLVKIQPKTHAPPRVRITWGVGLSFAAIVETVTQRFTLFSPSGVPVRAVVSVAFREYKSLEDQLAELKLESADHTSRRVVRRGDTLAGLAAEAYGDPRQWKRIAEANDVADPRHLAPGAELAIPPLDVAPTGAGAST